MSSQPCGCSTVGGDMSFLIVLTRSIKPLRFKRASRPCYPLGQRERPGEVVSCQDVLALASVPGSLKRNKELERVKKRRGCVY